MKAPVAIAAIAVIGLVAIGAWRSQPLAAAAALDASPSAATGSAQAPSTEATSRVALPERNASPAGPDQPVTRDRRRIFDAPDILQRVVDVRSHGTPDEKAWALGLVSSCALLFIAPLPASATANAGLPEPASSPDSEQLARHKTEAVDSLRSRCSGFKDLTAADRHALEDDLRAGASASDSPFGKLSALVGRGDSPWTPAEVQLISDSLYSEDPIVAREAFSALLSAFDSNAPGGEVRQAAFLYAAGGEFTSAPLSDYERLQRCRSLGRCETPWTAAAGAPPSPEIDRLAQAYGAALASHAGARDILAIR